MDQDVRKLHLEVYYYSNIISLVIVAAGVVFLVVVLFVFLINDAFVIIMFMNGYIGVRNNFKSSDLLRFVSD